MAGKYSSLSGYEKSSLSEYSRDQLRGIAQNYGIPLRKIIEEKLNKADLIIEIENNIEYKSAAPRKSPSINQFKGLTGYEEPLEDFTRDQLRAIASRLGIPNYSRYVKEKLADLIANNPLFRRNEPDKVTLLKKRLSKINNNPDAMMRVIQQVFRDTDPVPIPGKAYTFIYNAKTPGIEYDQHPLIIVDYIAGTWGFKGFNVHWGDYRNYTWPEVGSSFHIVKKGAEFDFLCDIPYMKKLQN
jgi:hypothetical protein